MTLTLQHPERLWLVGAILAVAAVFLLWGYRKSPLRGVTKWAAMACKLGAWGLVVFCLTDPVWSRKQPKTGENEETETDLEEIGTVLQIGDGIARIYVDQSTCR